MVDIPHTFLNFAVQEVREEDDSKLARDAGGYYIVRECSDILNFYKLRFKEQQGAYWLDGKPVSIGELITAANKALHRRGQKGDLGKNPDWHYPK